MPQVQNKTVGPIGYGLMGFTWRPDPVPTEQAIETMKAALDSGATLWNGGEFYGTADYNSMTILNRYFTAHPEDADKVTLIIKGGCDLTTLRPDGSPEAIRKSADNIIAQLGDKKKLDAFGIGRRDPRASLETTLSVLQKEYVDTGKIGGISLSECSAETIHEAAKYAKITAVEVEVSMFTRDNLDNGVAAACAQHGIPIVAYSPIGRGMLTGRFKSAADAKYLGYIGTFPRFQGDALDHNLKLVEKVHALAESKGCTPAQLALAWVRSVSRRSGMPTVIPIPGSTTAARVQENSKPIDLSDAELKEINDVVDAFETAGTRYPTGVPTET